MMPILLALHLGAGIIALCAGRRLGRWTTAIALLPLVATVIAFCSATGDVLDGRTASSSWTWVRSLSVTASFRLDGFAVLLALLVSVIGALVLVYSAGYFDLDDPRRVRFTGGIVLFAGAMLGLVTAADVWTLFAFWELTSVLSFFLIGLDDTSPAVRTSALRALFVTGAGGLVLLGGLLCLVHAAGSTRLDEILSAAPSSTTAQVGLALVLLGAFTKSAQVPFHFWLPGAMAAPTPVSAYLHSATMVKAGIVVVARFAPVFAELSWWQPTTVVVGGVTMLAGGWAALRRADAKQALAYGTVSQLGFLVVLFGLGTPLSVAAGVAVLLAHALFKSGLFLAVGAVDHATGSRDLRILSGVGRRLPLLAAAAGVCALSMVGIVPALGFVSKEAALSALIEGDDAWSRIALVVVIVGSVLTTAYTVRLWWGMFGSKRRGDDVATVHHVPSLSLVLPIVCTAVLTLLGGLLASALAERLTFASGALDEEAHAHLRLWPGVHAPLLVSVAIVIGGVALATVLSRYERLVRHGGATFGERSFRSVYDGLLVGARRVTTVTQSGSLPVYVAVVFTVVVAAVGFALATGAGDDWGDPVLADSVLQGAVAVLGIVVAIAVVAARRRFVSVLLLGGVGQALTVIFLMYGAPDLALTQFMIETLTIVAFVLVLRHLPADFARPPSWAPRALRIGISVAVGVVFAWIALAAGSVERPTDVTDTIEQLSLPAAGGKNVVNVTIVDFRGVDTMFEITVFGVAALGVANLVTASRRSVGYSGRTIFAKIGAESMIFDQVIRMIFHVTLLVSLYVALRGHNAPGGGFAGGLIAGAAFVFRLLAGTDTSRSALRRPSPVTMIAVGMLMATGTGVASLLTGNEFLETAIVHVDLPLIGDVKLVSAGIFDLGVYVLVIGVVILVLSHLASRTHSGGAVREGAAA